MSRLCEDQGAANDDWRDAVWTGAVIIGVCFRMTKDANARHLQLVLFQTDGIESTKEGLDLIELAEVRHVLTQASQSTRALCCVYAQALVETLCQHYADEALALGQPGSSQVMRES